MEREAWVLQRWLALCKDLGIDAAFAEEWGGKIMDGYRYFYFLYVRIQYTLLLGRTCQSKIRTSTIFLFFFLAHGGLFGLSAYIGQIMI